jgi:hypothetical protein
MVIAAALSVLTLTLCSDSSGGKEEDQGCLGEVLCIHMMSDQK